MKALWPLLVLGVLGVVASSSSEAPPPASRRRPRHVLLLGDSLAQGLALPLGALARADGGLFTADGRPSTRGDQWASSPWLGEDLELAIPNLVLVSLGTNDLRARGLDASDVRAIAAAVAKAGARLVWLAPPAMPFDGGRTTIADVVTREGVELVDARELAIERGPDQIHPTAAGYALWSRAIWESIR